MAVVVFCFFVVALQRYWIGTRCWQILRIKWLGLRLCCQKMWLGHPWYLYMQLPKILIGKISANVLPVLDWIIGCHECGLPSDKWLCISLPQASLTAFIHPSSLITHWIAANSLILGYLKATQMCVHAVQRRRSLYVGEKAVPLNKALLLMWSCPLMPPFHPEDNSYFCDLSHPHRPPHLTTELMQSDTRSRLFEFLAHGLVSDSCCLWSYLPDCLRRALYWDLLCTHHSSSRHL